MRLALGNVKIRPHGTRLVVEVLAPVEPSDVILSPDNRSMDIHLLVRVCRDVDGSYRVGQDVTSEVRDAGTPYFIVSSYAGRQVENKHLLIYESELLCAVDRDYVECEFGPEPENS